MLADDVGMTNAAPPWRERAGKALRRRWVQVAVVLAGWLLVVAVSARVLAPQAVRKAADQTQFKYVYCPKCEYEARYDAKLDGEPCPRCSQDPVGTLVGSETSVKDLDRRSGWRWFYLAAAVESLAALGGVVYLLQKSAADPAATYYVFGCPHCGQRLRFRHVSLGGLGLCSRCKRPLRFPDEDAAVREADLIRAEEERLAAEADDEDDEE